MKKYSIIFCIILALALLCSCGAQRETIPDEPETVPLSGKIIVPDGAILETPDRSVSYTARYSEIHLWDYTLYEINVDWLYDYSDMAVSLNEENLSVKKISDNYFIAEKEMNAKEIETLKDKTAEFIYIQENKTDITKLYISNPLILADRFVMLEANYNGDKYASLLLYLEDDGNWSLKEFFGNETLGREKTPHLSYIDPEKKVDGKTPYSIDVNRVLNYVTVYTLDEVGEYTVPVKAFVCSTGREGHESPTGDYKISDFRPRWCYMVDGSYGQYVSGWRSGGYLFHTICYEAQRTDSMMTEEYNLLGSNASLGCIRLQTIDAKWVYDNCIIGTPVHVFDSEDEGPLAKPTTLVEFIDEDMANGWDPTDPKPDNPWRTKL